jgi:uncharacterized membrane protein
MTTVLLHEVTGLAFVVHVGGGFVGLVSGTVALLAGKGGRLHRAAGTVFFASMLVMATLACYLAVVRPGQIVNLFIGIFASYLVATGWLAVRREAGAAGAPERIALGVAVVLCAPFAVLSIQLAAGLPPFFKSAVPLVGPVRVAIYSFTSVLAIAAIGDATVVFAGGLSAAPRVARHLWRMCLGLTLAAGSAFTNGFARLLPGPYHVPDAFFFPQFIPVAFLIFWMIRVRFTGWLGRRSVAVSESA